MLRAKSSQLSFYGSHIYDRVIPETHFLKLLDKAADFSAIIPYCPRFSSRLQLISEAS
jgi:hypothetical protein